MINADNYKEEFNRKIVSNKKIMVNHKNQSHSFLKSLENGTAPNTLLVKDSLGHRYQRSIFIFRFK